jgi:transposase-like protein
MTSPFYSGYRFPADVIRRAIWLYLRFTLRLSRRRGSACRAESSHVPVRRRERKLQGFKSPRSAQRFLTMHAATYNTFNVCRHLTTARTHRLFRAEAFAAWRDAGAVTV